MAGLPERPPAVLLLEVRAEAGALQRLGHHLGELIEGPREVAVGLGNCSPEEVLSACASLGITVLRSRVVSGHS